MRDLIEQSHVGEIEGGLEVEADLQIDGPQGLWMLSGRGNSIHLEIPSLSSGLQLARRRQDLEGGQRCLVALGANVTIWLHGQAIVRTGSGVSGNLLGRLVGVHGVEIKPGGLLRGLLARKTKRNFTDPALH